MKKIFKHNGTVFALFMFLPITPSIAAITVFTHSFINDRRIEVNSRSHHAGPVIDSISYQ